MSGQNSKTLSISFRVDDGIIGHNNRDFIANNVESEHIQDYIDVICSGRETVRVNGTEMPHEIAKSCFLKLNSSHLDYVLTAMKNSASEIRNIRAYLITALYNAPTTMDSYYLAWVNHDMHGSQ